MSLDVYSPCPGGFDRKIKFCCTDLVSSLDQIMTQLDGDQVQGALRSIDRQLQSPRIVPVCWRLRSTR